MSSEMATRKLYADVNSYRELGNSELEIARKMNISLAAVETVPLPRPKPDRARAVQHQQLMKMAQALMPKVAAGDQNAIRDMLKVMQREASLLGLDAPKEVISHNFNSMEDRPLRELSTVELERMLIEGESNRVEE